MDRRSALSWCRTRSSLRPPPHSQISVCFNYFTLEVRFVLLSHWIAAEGELIGVYWMARRVTGRPLVKDGAMCHLLHAATSHAGCISCKTNLYFNHLVCVQVVQRAGWFKPSHVGLKNTKFVTAPVSLEKIWGFEGRWFGSIAKSGSASLK